MKTYAQGITHERSRAAIVSPSIRDRRDLESFGIHAAVRFNHEFGVLAAHGSPSFQRLASNTSSRSAPMLRAYASSRSNGRRSTAVRRRRRTGRTRCGSFRTPSIAWIPILDVVTPEGDPDRLDGP